MMMDKLLGTQSVIVTLDVDTFLFDKLERIAQAGFTVVEINSAEPALLQNALYDFPSLNIGAGNIINSQQLDDCYQAGAHFVTSPGYLAALAQTAAIYSINYIPSIATISEAMQASAMGCQHIRVFPANLNLCTVLNKALPALRLFPAEIEWDEVEHFLSLPAVAAVSILNPEIKQLNALSENLMSVNE